MTELTQEEINRKIFVYAYEMMEDSSLPFEAVQKIREVFLEDRTLVWFLVSRDSKVDNPGYSAPDYFTNDTVLCVSYIKSIRTTAGDKFEWAGGSSTSESIEIGL